MEIKGLELFIREKALIWVRKEIRKNKRSLYLLESDPVQYGYRGTKNDCELAIAKWTEVASEILNQINELVNK